MKNYYAITLVVAIAGSMLLVANPSAAQWASGPGSTMRNAFGPDAGGRANQCRGACGSGCPASCAKEIAYECLDTAQLRRVEILTCGTHQGCRVHDDCLDACVQSSTQSGDCQRQCDTQVMERFGFESSASWLTGAGPYDGKATFEYTRDAPGAPEPAYRCPTGATRQCGGNPGCTAADGSSVDPVFDTYPTTAANAMRVSDFSSGLVCGEKVCQQTADIQVYGEDSCPGGDCTRFGMEFNFENADPAAPLECTTSTSGGDSDFVGGLLKQGGDAMTSRGGGGDGSGEDGMAELLGMFGKVLASADSPEDVNVSMVPLDENGNPIESQRVGSTPRDGPPPVPNSVDLPGKSGHLFVPMYQLAAGMSAGQIKERKIRCTHKDTPVLETVFRLQRI